ACSREGADTVEGAVAPGRGRISLVREAPRIMTMKVRSARRMAQRCAHGFFIALQVREVEQLCVNAERRLDVSYPCPHAGYEYPRHHREAGCHLRQTRNFSVTV